MGRLSEARKKAGKKKKPAKDAIATPVTADKEALPPETNVETTDPDVEARPSGEAEDPSRGAAEPQSSKNTTSGVNAGRSGDEVPVQPPETASKDASDLPDDAAPAAAVQPDGAQTGDAQSPSLPASGLADDILAAMEKTDPVTRDADAGGSGDTPVLDDDWDEAWAGFTLDQGKDNFDPQALPSSGLADEVLQIVGRTGETRDPLSLEDIHEFESFYGEDDHDADEQLQLVHFSIQGEVYALDISRVQEIIRVPVVTRVPNAAPHVMGVFNLRGRILAVFDLRTLLKLELREPDKASRIMVLDLEGKSLGLLIDRVVEVASIDIPDVEPSPNEVSAIDANLVTGVARYREQMVFLLDVDRVLGFR